MYGQLRTEKFVLLLPQVWRLPRRVTHPYYKAQKRPAYRREAEEAAQAEQPQQHSELRPIQTNPSF
jgi:hypothetical protein